MKSKILMSSAIFCWVMTMTTCHGQTQLDFSEADNLFDAVETYIASGALDKPDSLKSGADKEMERYF